MAETKAFFSRMGADAFVIDSIRWGGEDLALDLNKPVRFWTKWRTGEADLIVDPGTIEHCFNVAQAFDNIDRLLAAGGVIYHQAAAAFPNHGFWSISPTAFFDFYQSRRYELGHAKQTVRALDQDGFVIDMKDLNPFEPIPHPEGPLILHYAFRKPLRRKRPSAAYPTQRCYSSESREIVMTDLFPVPGQISPGDFAQKSAPFRDSH